MFSILLTSSASSSKIRRLSTKTFAKKTKEPTVRNLVMNWLELFVIAKRKGQFRKKMPSKNKS